MDFVRLCTELLGKRNERWCGIIEEKIAQRAELFGPVMELVYGNSIALGNVRGLFTAYADAEGAMVLLLNYSKGVSNVDVDTAYLSQMDPRHVAQVAEELASHRGRLLLPRDRARGKVIIGGRQVPSHVIEGGTAVDWEAAFGAVNNMVRLGPERGFQRAVNLYMVNREALLDQGRSFLNAVKEGAEVLAESPKILYLNMQVDQYAIQILVDYLNQDAPTILVVPSGAHFTVYVPRALGITRLGVSRVMTLENFKERDGVIELKVREGIDTIVSGLRAVLS